MGAFAFITRRYFIFLILFGLSLRPASADEIELEDGEITAPVGGPVLQPGENPELDLVFVNGQRTSAERALEQAKATGDALRCPCRLIYHDGTLPIIDDIAIAWDKLFDADVSLNAATDTLITEIRGHVEAGKDIFIVCFSGGTVITNNAVRSVADDYEDLCDAERKHRLGHIHIVAVGSAVFDDDNIFADGWPEGIGSRFDFFDVRDGIAQFAGLANWGEDVDEAHSYLENYAAHLDRRMLVLNGRQGLGQKR